MESQISVDQTWDDAAALKQARSAWHAAHYTRCLELLVDVEPTARRFLLAASAAYRLRRTDEALSQLQNGDVYFTSAADQMEADALSAVLYEMRGNGRESATFYERACIGAKQHIAEAACNFLALRAWMRGDHAECLRHLRVAESSADANIRAYALSLRAWMHGARRQYFEQAHCLLLSTKTALTCTEPDIGTVASNLQILSALAREVWLPDALQFVARNVRQIQWSPDLRVREYHATRHLAWADALAGRYVNGIRQLMRAHELADDDLLRSMSALDAGWIAFSSGERVNAEAYLSAALERMDSLEWSGRREEESATLLLAAELCAEIDPRRAAQLLETYDRVYPSMPASVGARHSGAFEPVESYARAVVLRARGSASSARKYAKAAYETFAEMRYDWRAARCALFLYDAGCGDSWLEAAKERAREYPRSFIGAQIKRIESDSRSEPLARLTPRQREVVRRLIAGDTIDGVASSLNASRNTIKVHLKHIYSTLGVRNRAEFLRQVKGIAV